MVDIRIEDYNIVVFEVNIMFSGVVSSVEVVGECGEFSGDSVNLFDKRSDIGFNMEMMNSKFVGVEYFGDLFVSKIKLFSVKNEGGRNVGSVVLIIKRVSYENKLVNDLIYEIICFVLINFCNLVKN